MPQELGFGKPQSRRRVEEFFNSLPMLVKANSRRGKGSIAPTARSEIWRSLPARFIEICLNGPFGFSGILLATTLLQEHHRTLPAFGFASMANRCDDLFDASVELCHC